MVTPELIAYRKEMERLGYDTQRIWDELTRVGWSEQVIKELLHTPLNGEEPRSNTPAEMPPRKVRTIARKKSRSASQSGTDMADVKPRKTASDRVVPTVSHDTHTTIQKDASSAVGMPVPDMLPRKKTSVTQAIIGYLVIACAGIAFGYFIVFDLISVYSSSDGTSRVNELNRAGALTGTDVADTLYVDGYHDTHPTTVSWAYLDSAEDGMAMRAVSTVSAGKAYVRELGIAFTLPDSFDEYHLEMVRYEADDTMASSAAIQFTVDAGDTKWIGDFTLWRLLVSTTSTLASMGWRLEGDTTYFDPWSGFARGFVVGASEDRVYVLERPETSCPAQFKDPGRIRERTPHCEFYDRGPDLFRETLELGLAQGGW